MKKITIFLLFCAAMLGACRRTTEQQLLGKWKLDSAYYHYNQFGFSSGGWHQEEVYEFLPSGETRTIAQNSILSNDYEIKDSQLSYFDEEGVLINTYEILLVDGDQLVLRAEKQPLFKGNNQNRFEVRYFSKLD
ncbi:hypothetical protein [Cyclobacterium jeungdonense]|uniref:Lipocalin-like domain-containing protein n=1 Tax=Cyclobacterium jeungdonense TaxID=708087 RepID=A0ABT8C3R3_9BACT|nr:hypothetical protein [Cyclobacterium jeungdonense]MDN3686263.1 hypothetical protein [Cyclobacterium jeungdonense]